MDRAAVRPMIPSPIARLKTLGGSAEGRSQSIGGVMTWNYRVICKADPNGPGELFGIHEVYYDSNGRIEGWTEEPCDPFGESLDELHAEMEMMMAALAKPVLKESNLLHDVARRSAARQDRSGVDE